MDWTSEKHPTFVKSLKKFSSSSVELAHEFMSGVDAGLARMNPANDYHWAVISFRDDMNGNPSIYVDLHSCSHDSPHYPFS